MTKPINIGLFGLGTVGSGVAKVLTANAVNIAHKIGAPVKIKKVLVRNPAKARSVKLDAKITTDVQEILDDKDIAIVVELMGGEQPAKDYIVRALQAGKHVVTANKDVVSKYGRELFAAAEENCVDFSLKPAWAAASPLSAR